MSRSNVGACVFLSSLFLLFLFFSRHLDIAVLGKKKYYTRKKGKKKGEAGEKIHTCQIRLRTLFLCPGQRVIDERFVLAQACEVAGLTARRANGREGGTLLRGGGIELAFGSYFSEGTGLEDGGGGGERKGKRECVCVFGSACLKTTPKPTYRTSRQIREILRARPHWEKRKHQKKKERHVRGQRCEVMGVHYRCSSR